MWGGLGGACTMKVERCSLNLVGPRAKAAPRTCTNTFCNRCISHCRRLVPSSPTDRTQCAVRPSCSSWRELSLVLLVGSGNEQRLGWVREAAVTTRMPVRHQLAAPGPPQSREFPTEGDHVCRCIVFHCASMITGHVQKHSDASTGAVMPPLRV